ncbi:MAG: transporter substrate-binding domain-containing protein [Desulfobacter sp.]|nr:MAG: transporter substrate-binding domain-containing protein [Desulfobacter sp.]
MAAADEITVVGDDWPPFNHIAGAKNEGYMIDIARAVFVAEGHGFHYLVLPWKRALRETRRGRYTAVVGASKTDAKGFVFPSQELARNYLAFYTKKGTPWQYKEPSSLKQIKLATIASYDYRPWLNEYVASNLDNPEKVFVNFGLNPLEKNLRLLMAGRVDAVVDNDAAIRFVARQMNLGDKIQLAGQGTLPSFCYIAFSPGLDRSKSYARILSRGIAEMRKSGRLKQILNKYDLEDWRSPTGNPAGTSDTD